MPMNKRMIVSPVAVLLLAALLLPAGRTLPLPVDAAPIAKPVPVAEDVVPAAPAAASAAPDQYLGLTIYDVQYTTYPTDTNGNRTYPSLYLGQSVLVTGTVCALLPNAFVVVAAPGPWQGLYVYTGSGGCRPDVGTLVQVGDQIVEYQGMTEMSIPTALTFLGPGPAVCSPTVVTTADVPYDEPDISEPYEGTMLEYRDFTVTVVEEHQVLFTDAAGRTGAIDKHYSYYPPDIAPGQVYDYARGALACYYDDAYRLRIASAADIRLRDITPPTVVETVPPPGGIGSPYAELVATFSEAVVAESIVWTLQGPAGPVAGTTAYDPATHRSTFTPDSFLDPLAHYTATIAGSLRDLRGNPMGADHTWTFDTSEADTDPPGIAGHLPARNAGGVSIYATVVITFDEAMDPATINGSNIVVKWGTVLPIAGGVSYDPATYRATFRPQGLLDENTPYKVEVSAQVADRAGNPYGGNGYNWTFTTGSAPTMIAYHGDIHNHTSYSDGSGTPAQAVAVARAAGLDFFAITDHSYAVDDGEWLDTLAQVNAASQDGQFIALRGFEYTQGGEGHINVYNTVRHATRSNVAGCSYCDYTPNLEAGVTVQGFYPWLAITGTQALDDAGTVMQFNHPGWMNFNDWTYHPEVEATAELEEVGNGWGSSYVFSYDEWIRSLDYGWKVAATNNTDNHTPYWGTIGSNRTGVLMPELTKDALLEALRARRTFATEDKNSNLYFKANGYWMGSEIPNAGQISFEMWGDDPDAGDTLSRVQLVTSQGRVVAEYAESGTSFHHTYNLDVSPGAHYYFLLVTQADGDRIVSSPVWTQGTDDIRLTDLTIQPSLPTIYNPNLLTARVTNRGPNTETVTVTFSVGGTPIGSLPVTVAACRRGPCPDGYVSISWQPAVTGDVTVVAALEGAPAADNPDDNARELTVSVSDERIPLILIDAGHNNIGTDRQGTRMFVDDLTLHGYNVLFNLDELTAGDLNTETVKLVVLNAYGPDQLTGDEIQALADFVAAGGSLWLNGMSDYTGKVAWAHNVADRMNALVEAVAAVAGEVPIRFNDDEVLDGNDNNGYPWGVLWHNFPFSMTTGVGVNVNRIQSWSDSSLIDASGSALQQDDLGDEGFIMVLGDTDPGTGTYGEGNWTHNVDAEGCGYPTGDAYIYISTTAVLPMGAGYDIPGEAGRLFFYGDSNDPFNVFAYVVGDGKQNELFNLEVVMWLLGEPLQKSAIAEVRAGGDEPVNLDRLVWVEGVVTAGFGEFFDVLYVQDATGGITVFAPAGTASGEENEAVRGDCVRVVGTVDVYQGDTEIQFFEATQVQVLTPSCVYSPSLAVDGSWPVPMSTGQAGREEHEGWLVVVTGTVVQKEGSDTLWVDDGSGPLRLFLDGYNGDWSDAQVGDVIRVASPLSEDYFGARMRVRNHGAHPGLPDDVVFLEAPLPYVAATWPAAGAVDVPLGATVVVTFSRPMDPATLMLTAVPDPGGWTAAWSHYGMVAHLSHAPLAYSTTYDLEVAALDTLGQAIAAGPVPNPWSFTTRLSAGEYRIYLPLVEK